MTLYQRIRTADGAPIGQPGGLPRALKGLTPWQLEDLSGRLGEASAARLGYAGAGFIRYVAPPPVPVEIERLWALLALQGAGLYDIVEAAVEGAELATRLYYREAGLFRRDSAILIEFAHGLGMTDQQLDDLFRAAANLKALAAPA
ncbi:hypothetical protein [Synechococcus phage Ssp-JY42]|nr:hypothetical protein [Synechococcus phage Yong-M4-211]